MSTLRRYPLVPWVLSVAALAYAGGARIRAADPRVEKTLADWQNRQAAVETAHWRLKGEHVLPAGALTDKVGLPLADGAQSRKDLTYPQQLMLHADFASGRYRLEDYKVIRSVEGTVVEPYVLFWAFDGKTLNTWLPRDLNTKPGSLEWPREQAEIGVMTGDMSQKPLTSGLDPVFFGHGIIPLSNDLVYPGHFRKTYNPESLVVHGDGAVYAGRRCLVLRTRPRFFPGVMVDEYWVDPGRDSAILRRVKYQADKPKERFRVNEELRVEQQQTEKGWFPSRWERTSFSGGKVDYIERQRVESLELGAPLAEEDLHFEARPGMLVNKTRFRPPTEDGRPSVSEVRYERVDEDGRARPEAHPFATVVEQSGWGVWGYATLVAGVAAFGASMYFLWKGFAGKRRQI